MVKPINFVKTPKCEIEFEIGMIFAGIYLESPELSAWIMYMCGSTLAKGLTDKPGR